MILGKNIFNYNVKHNLCDVFFYSFPLIIIYLVTNDSILILELMFFGKLELNDIYWTKCTNENYMIYMYILCH